MSVPGPQEFDKIRAEITELLEQRKCAPLLLRLAFHDAFTYDSGSSTGGANGSIRNEKELRHPGNEGLKAAVEALGGIKESHPSLTYAGQALGVFQARSPNHCKGCCFLRRSLPTGGHRGPGDFRRTCCALQSRHDSILRHAWNSSPSLYI